MTNNYIHPTPGLPGRLLARLANSRRIAAARRAVFSRLPFLTLESDVRDVVYLTWMMDAATAQAMVPAGVRLWQRNGLTPFSILTYRHGHFGPALAGPARRLLPSPLQSNWRFYLEEPGKVYFVRNVMDRALHALGTRIFSDILPTHLPERFVHAREGEEYFHQHRIRRRQRADTGSPHSCLDKARLACGSGRCFRELGRGSQLPRMPAHGDDRGTGPWPHGGV